MSSNQIVEKYKKPVRVLHWVHGAAFVMLFLTGLILFVPGLSILAQDSITRVIHRIGAVVFIAAPIIYTILDPAAVVRALKKAFTWSAEDIGWLKAAPAYYFLNKEDEMPPQGEMNTGQKLWWFITVVFSALFIITGLLMWFGKMALSGDFLQWMVFLHDVSFIVTGCMLFVHIYLSLLHPMMTEAMQSMLSGKISAEYAKSHHGKWYNELTKGKKA